MYVWLPSNTGRELSILFELPKFTSKARAIGELFFPVTKLAPVSRCPMTFKSKKGILSIAFISSTKLNCKAKHNIRPISGVIKATQTITFPKLCRMKIR